MKEFIWILLKGDQSGTAVDASEKIMDLKQGGGRGRISPLLLLLAPLPGVRKELDSCPYKWVGCIHLFVYVSVVLISSPF